MSIPKIEKLEIKNEKNVTKQDIIDESEVIYRKCMQVWEGIVPISSKKKPVKIKETDYKLLDDLYNRLVKEHRDFASAYPTVLRHLAQEKWFSPIAFRKYLDVVEKAPWTNDTARMDSYTEYAVILLRETNKDKHLNATIVESFRRDYRERLQKEHDTFLEKINKYKQEVEETETLVKSKSKVDLLYAFKRLSAMFNVDSERVAKVEELVNSGQLSVDELDNIVYNMKKTAITLKDKELKEAISS